MLTSVHNYSKWYQNYHFYVQLSFFIVSLGSLSWHYWFLVFNEALINPKYCSDVLAWDFFGYWSMQSTVIVLFYSLLNIIYYLKPNMALQWVTNFHIRNFTNIFLVIAMISYYVAIIIGPPPINDLTKKFAYRNYWIPTHIQHFCLPILMLVYSLFAPSSYISLSKYLKKNLYLYYLYPMFYGFFVLLRGHIKIITEQGNNHYDWTRYYPYFFFNVQQTSPNGWLVFFVAYIIFFLVFLILGSIFIYINNFLILRRQDYPQ